jgi:hypothetical protein
MAQWEVPKSASNARWSAGRSERAVGEDILPGILTEKMLLSLIASDTWKRTFVFGPDLTKLFRVVDDLRLLYQTFIRQLFALFHDENSCQLNGPSPVAECEKLENNIFEILKVGQFTRSQFIRYWSF